MDPLIAVEIKPEKGWRSSWSIQRMTDDYWLCRYIDSRREVFLSPTFPHFKRRRRFKREEDAQDHILKLYADAIKAEKAALH